MKKPQRLIPLLVIVVASALAAWRHPTPGRLSPELAWCMPQMEHPLGCGEAGMDLAAIVSHAELRAIALAIAVALTGFLFGTFIGAMSGLIRGMFERTVERVCDLLQAFPTFLLALAVLSAVRAPNRFHLGAVFALTAWAPFARLSLVQTRVLRDAAFIEAAGAIGARFGGIVVRHIVPNLLGVVAVQLGSTAAAIIVSEAALGFVGLGPHDGVSIGAVLDQGVAAMLRAPHVLLVGASAVFATSSSFLLAARSSPSE